MHRRSIVSRSRGASPHSLLAVTLSLIALACSEPGSVSCTPDTGTCAGPNAGVVGADGTPGAADDGAPPTSAPPTSATPAPGASSSPAAPAPGGAPAKPAELDCSSPRVGVAPLRRLDRAQYARAVRDLLGVEAAPSADFPADEKLGPFHADIATPVDRLVVEQYLSSAESVAAAAVERLSELTTCDRASEGDAACASELIRRLGALTYRRPLLDEEVARYEALYAADARGFESGVRQVLTALLVSPNFLYQLELAPDAAGPPGPRELDGYELAARLSFTLWGSAPDAELARAAGRGELSTVEGIRARAERMLSDPRAADAIESFHLQLLGLDGLAELGKDPRAFPGFDSSTALAMRRETARFVNYVVRESDGLLSTLLTSPMSFPEGPLFELYGIDSAEGNGPVELDAAQRAGLLTQPAFLAMHAHPNQTSPVRRGVVVRRNFLCTPLPDPPPNVNTSAPVVSADATTRQRFAAHSADAACSGCHSLIDPIGFAFENYDAIGRFRTTENGVAIAASGELLAADGTKRPFADAVELAQELAASPEVQSCYARQWFRFALARQETQADECSLARIDQAFSSSNFDVRELLFALVTSDAFRHAATETP